MFPFLRRIADRDTTLPTGGGPKGDSPIFVPKGTCGDVNFVGLHRDTSVFGPNADVFDPHRWENIKPTAKEFVPFGAGGRSCLGKDKALAESAYVLARLAREFDFLENKNKEGFKGKVKIAMQNGYGCNVVFKRRIKPGDSCIGE